LSKLNLSYEAVAYITSAPPASITWLTIAEAKQYGIDATLFEPNWEAVGVARPAAMARVNVQLAKAPQSPQSLKDAAAAYRRGDHATALRLFRPLADQWPTEASQSAKHEYQSSPPSNTRSVTEERAVQVTPVVATAPKPWLSADQEVACREKLRSRGIYLIAGNPCIDIDLIIKNLAEGTYSFNKPDSAYVEEPFRVVLTLTTAPDQDVSSVFLGTEGKVTAKQGQFAQHLEARLRGGIDFKVDPSDPQEQTVTSLNPVVWEWSVTPRKPGNKTMFIDVAANLILGTQQEHVQLKTLDERIEIRVSILHFILAAVTSLWGVALGIATMIIAILGVVHYSRSLRRMREHRDGDPDEPPPVELITHQQSHSESSATHSSSA
jgi:hypothetical protein